MSLTDKGVIESARRLDEVEREFLKLSYESPRPENKSDLGKFSKRIWELGCEAFNIRNEIAETFSESINIQIHDPKVREILNKVRANEKFYSITFYEFSCKEIESKSGENFPFSVDFEQFIESKYDEWYMDFYQRFHLTSYYKSIISIGPIFSSVSIPKDAEIYFNEIREAYALELKNSAIALSRSVMEMCLFDKLQRKGYFKQSKIVKLDAEREDKLHYLIGTAYKEKLLDCNTRELAHEIRQIANRILHPKKDVQKSESGGRDILFIISGVIKVVEKLYS
jgi:hypothetical protein